MGLICHPTRSNRKRMLLTDMTPLQRRWDGSGGGQRPDGRGGYHPDEERGRGPLEHTRRPPGSSVKAPVVVVLHMAACPLHSRGLCTRAHMRTTRLLRTSCFAGVCVCVCQCAWFRCVVCLLINITRRASQPARPRGCAKGSLAKSPSHRAAGRRPAHACGWSRNARGRRFFQRTHRVRPIGSLRSCCRGTAAARQVSWHSQR